ncbi:peptidase M23 [Gloeomargarita lithophora Alchichica-D10]|uniref:Peptidase M23 n=1 Tax=Gloeomargarita lithophora Alchichica-D10 TaxID=1188229 RepID=A0A1J0AH95_9CYAN|nr:peptidoglycan DD-metalloendopeptidase family protein [Gloeomargarita lithophora]APB35267.1 peptidase M23 [Gloeomargarita lithophora Alchichica-D10]
MQQHDFASFDWQPVQVSQQLSNLAAGNASSPNAIHPLMTGLAAVGALASVGQGVAVANPALAPELPASRQEGVVAAVPDALVVEHRVRAGETLWQLSHLYQVTIEEIAQQNGLRPEQVLVVGQVLKIPPRSPEAVPNRVENLLARVRQQALVREGRLPADAAAMMNSPSLVDHGAQEVSPKKAGQYQVQPGDTLTAIARRFRVSLSQLAKVNRLANPNLLQVGQTLRVPGMSNSNPASATAQRPVPQVLARLTAPRLSALKPPTPQPQTLRAPGIDLPRLPVNPLLGTDALGELGTAPLVNTDQLRRQPGVQNLAAILPRVFPPALSEGNPSNDSIQALSLPPMGEAETFLPKDPTFFKGYVWPARGVMTSGFGRRWGRMHQGIDIAAPVGTPVVASAGGTVIFAGWNSGGYGNLVKIWHDNGSVTFYAHNNRLLVRENQQVEQGQLIAEMGSTGFSTGPHVHFEIRKRDRGPVNPMALLSGQR